MKKSVMKKLKASEIKRSEYYSCLLTISEWIEDDDLILKNELNKTQPENERDLKYFMLALWSMESLGLFSYNPVKEVFDVVIAIACELSNQEIRDFSQPIKSFINDIYDKDTSVVIRRKTEHVCDCVDCKKDYDVEDVALDDIPKMIEIIYEYDVNDIVELICTFEEYYTVKDGIVGEAIALF